MRRRVAVTGIGIVSPLGTGTEATWKALVEGRTGTQTLTRYDPSEYAAIPSRVAGQIDQETLPPLSAADVRLMPPYIHYALVAAQEAMEQSGGVDPSTCGVAIGTGIGDLEEVLQGNRSFEAGYRRLSPFFVPKVLLNMAGGHLSMKMGLQGPNLCTVTACASGAHTIADAFRLIREGYATSMIAGGTEAAIHPLAVAGFARCQALSTSFNDEPEKASRPFDVHRDGFVIGEGSAVLVLEEMESALKANKRVLCEMLGCGYSADAFHITKPAQDGNGAYRCMEQALSDGDVDTVDYVNAHGTSTPIGDRIEAAAIERLFSARGSVPAIGSTKGATGHLLGAAGSLEAAFTVLSVLHNVIPPNVNLDQLDPEMEQLGCTFPTRALSQRVDTALSNSFGFGGTNASLLFGKVRG